MQRREISTGSDRPLAAVGVYHPGRRFSRSGQRSTGFTIVELLIVIVVIAILAAITIVAYNGIQDRARLSSLQNDVKQAQPQLELLRDDNGYPATADNLKKGADTALTYMKMGDGYCVQASNSSHDVGAFHAFNGSGVSPGPCPIGEWDFSGNADDRTPYGNDAIIMDATLTTDRHGSASSAYGFNGASGIHIPDSRQINTAGTLSQRTITLWFKADDVDTRQVIYEEGGSTRGLNIYLDGGMLYVNGYNLASGTVWGPKYVSTPVDADIEYHVALVMDQPSGTLGEYLDGSLVGQVSGVNVVYAHSDDVALGRALGTTTFHDGATSSSNNFHGSIDEVHLYNQALTAGEVKQIYQAG